MSKRKECEFNPEDDDCMITSYAPLPLTAEEQEKYYARRKARDERRKAKQQEEQAAEATEAVPPKKRVMLPSEPKVPVQIIIIDDKEPEKEEPAMEQEIREPPEVLHAEGNFAMASIFDALENPSDATPPDVPDSPDSAKASITGQASDEDQTTDGTTTEEDEPLLERKRRHDAIETLASLRNSPVNHEEADPTGGSPDFSGAGLEDQGSESTQASLPVSAEGGSSVVPDSQPTQASLPVSAAGGSSFVPDSQPSQEVAAIPTARFLESYAVPSGEGLTYVQETQGSQDAGPAPGDVRVAPEPVPVPVPAPATEVQEPEPAQEVPEPEPAQEVPEPEPAPEVPETEPAPEVPETEPVPDAGQPAAKAFPPEQDIMGLVRPWLDDWDEHGGVFRPYELVPNFRSKNIPKGLPKNTRFFTSMFVFNWHEFFGGKKFTLPNKDHLMAEHIPGKDLCTFHIAKYEQIINMFSDYKRGNNAHPVAFFLFITCARLGRNKQPVNLWKQDKDTKKLELLISDPEPKQPKPGMAVLDILVVFDEEKNCYYYISLEREEKKCYYYISLERESAKA